MSLEKMTFDGLCSKDCIYRPNRRTDNSSYLISSQRVNHELDATLLGLSRNTPEWLVRGIKYLADRFPIIYKFTMP